MSRYIYRQAHEKKRLASSDKYNRTINMYTLSFCQFHSFHFFSFFYPHLLVSASELRCATVIISATPYIDFQILLYFFPILSLPLILPPHLSTHPQRSKREVKHKRKGRQMKINHHNSSAETSLLLFHERVTVGGTQK